MELEKKLAHLRKKNGLSQMELAEKMQVSRQAVSKWEVGDAVPSTDNLGYLSRLYGVSMDFLLDDTTDLPEKAKEDPKAVVGILGDNSVNDEECPAKRDILYSKKATVKWAIIFLVFLVLATVAYLGIMQREDADKVQLADLTREEVDGGPNGEFSLKWD